MKRCSFCAEEIQDAAIKCRHCGEMLNAPPRGAPDPAPIAQGAGGRAQEPARPIYGGSPSWKAYFTRYLLAATIFVVGVAGASVASVLSHFTATIPAAIAAAALALIALVMVASVELKRRSTHYRVSTRRIDMEAGVFSKRIETLELWRVRDVQFKQSFSERMLGIGSIHVLTHDTTTPELFLLGLANARGVFEDLKTGIELSRQARNVVGVVE